MNDTPDDNGDCHAQERLRVGRFTVERKELCDLLEENNPSLYRKKVMFEVISGVLMDKLLGKCAKEYGFPATGLRLLLTSPTCPEHMSHTDARRKDMGSDMYWRAVEEVDYFVMASGAEPFTLRIWLHSHTLLRGPAEIVQKVRGTLPGIIVTIPAHSFFVGRADLLHAGTSGCEDPLRSERRPMQSPDGDGLGREWSTVEQSSALPYAVRAHMYAFRRTEKVANSIFLQ